MSEKDVVERDLRDEEGEAREFPERALPRSHGIKCHCANCHISVNVIATPPPTVCPYCRAAQVRTPFEVMPLTPSMAEGNHQERYGRLYRKPGKLLVFSAAGVGTLLLALSLIHISEPTRPY